MNDLIGTAAASTDSNGFCEAHTHLTNFRDLHGPHEIAVLYASFIPNWNDTLGYSMTHVDKDGVAQTITLSPPPYLINSSALNSLSTQIEEKFGANMKTAPVKIVSKRTTAGLSYFLRLQSNSEAELAPKLAELLGMENVIENETAKVKDFEINYTPFIPPLESSIYLITCDQIKPNFINPSGSLNKVLEIVHAPYVKSSDVVQYNSSYPIYQPLEEFLHYSLKFRLLKENGDPVQTETCHFYLKYHIRSRHAETSQ